MNQKFVDDPMPIVQHNCLLIGKYLLYLLADHFGFLGSVVDRDCFLTARGDEWNVDLFIEMKDCDLIKPFTVDLVCYNSRVVSNADHVIVEKIVDGRLRI
jgi:hypothetical protein